MILFVSPQFLVIQWPWDLLVMHMIIEHKIEEPCHHFIEVYFLKNILNHSICASFIMYAYISYFKSMITNYY